MFEEQTTQILLKFLEKKSREAEREIEEKGSLSDENAIPILLRTQFNHIAHLDSELTGLRELIDKRFEQVDKRFEQVDKRFEQVDKKFEHMENRFEHMEDKFDGKFSRIYTFLGLGFSVLAFIIILSGIF